MNAPLNMTEFAKTPPQLPIRNYHEFYRFYLTEHSNIMSRRLHAAGSTIGLYFFSKAIRQRKAKYFVYGLVSGYAMVIETTGRAISRAPISAASNGLWPSSMWRWMFSTTTMASSTTRPMASTMASRVSRLME